MKHCIFCDTLWLTDQTGWRAPLGTRSGENNGEKHPNSDRVQQADTMIFETHYAQLATAHCVSLRIVCLNVCGDWVWTLQKLWQIVVWNSWQGLWGPNCVRKHIRTRHETLCFQTRVWKFASVQTRSPWKVSFRRPVKHGKTTVLCLQTVCHRPICEMTSTSLRGGGPFGLQWIHLGKSYTTVDPKQWADSRSVSRNRVKHMIKH